MIIYECGDCRVSFFAQKLNRDNLPITFLPKMGSRPDDYVQCVTASGKKLRWNYRESRELVKLYHKLVNSECGKSIRQTLYECVVPGCVKPTFILIVRTVRRGSFAAQHTKSALEVVWGNPAYYAPGLWADATTLIFKTVDGSPEMLTARDLPAKIVSLISK